MLEIGDKRVFVTGGASGIGRAIIEALLAKGAKVLFCDVNADAGKGLETELRKQYGADRVIFAQCDVTNAQQLEDVFQKAVSSFGGLDVCVNNAGILDERIWETMLAINTTAQIRGCKLALDHMRRDKGGRGGVIINVASMAGIVAAHYHPVYTASKHAVVGFSLSWATHPKMGEMGVRWGCLCPGPVDTKLITVLEEGQAENLPVYRHVLDTNKVPPESAAQAFIRLLEDDESNGGLMTVVAGREQGHYRKRQLVDADGVSNPRLADIPWTPT
ncbi:15-hydroxyprostaglandin dehydrogenase [NAD(+)]-like [Littorina saxatilis]|uniref:15-hydroxyprostaglandin dehydrogenase [NAD(+)] n=1 Tax=Littorina saxatilis TaxID=31220 RepID=A0AAN9GQ11_9CAEN